ncbi:NADH:flavin oxidoreductase [uncultured Megasphaera sp.]|uniref:NADH:flavin oxidoreductase n=1 Tax=uncultured Megasphaera sp. TaxID=165188 RepID=UPI0025EE872E|nr:NADH:flavin oxidoreductase [uncultured Megasphaera sp.]
MKHLFDNITLKNLKSKNRLVRSATWEGIANRDGSVTEEAYSIYDEIAKGGVGIIITGFTSVAANDYYFGGMMRLSDDALIPQYKKLTDIIHAQGIPVITQLALGAYYRPVGNSFEQVEPDDMTTEELHWVRDQFIDAALRAEKAGFDGVQIHVAHFFFLSRLVSPLVNHRTDEYGGSTENRTRLVTEIIKAIREKAPTLHITAKINSNDFMAGGLDAAQSLDMCRHLCQAGLDSIEVSGNGTSVPGIRPHQNEAYFAPFAAKLAAETDVPVILVGGLRSLDTMEEVLNKTKIEMIALSRPLLREPDLPNKLESGETTVSACVSCNGCYSSPSHKCIFRKD